MKRRPILPLTGAEIARFRLREAGQAAVPVGLALRARFNPALRPEHPFEPGHGIEPRGFGQRARADPAAIPVGQLCGADRDEHRQRELEALAAGVKVMGTWHATRTIQECREACGGAGYLADLRDQLETNLFGAVWVTQAALPFADEVQGESGHG